MTETTTFSSRGVMTSPSITTRNRYDGVALAILDPARLIGVEDGARVTSVPARGIGPARLRDFSYTNDPGGVIGLKPFFRENALPDGGPALEFTGFEALRNGLDGANPLMMPFTLSFVVKMVSYDGTAARLAGRSLASEATFASVRPQLAGSSTRARVNMYTEANSPLYADRLLSDPTVYDWTTVICSFGAPDSGILFGDVYNGATPQVATGSAVNSLGANINVGIANSGTSDYGLGLKALIAEFRIDSGVMSETEMRKFRDDQMFRYGLT